MSLMNRTITVEQVDSLLPQTQCGLCGHGGCLPYSKAIVEKAEAINLCPPGGVETLNKLAALTAIDPTPYLNEMSLKAKKPMVAEVREPECIGCTKCIQACPVDAIIGTAKQMHSIITDQCTGCELCVPACPVDCIDMKPADYPVIDKTKADKFRQQLQVKNKRLDHFTKIETEALATPVITERKSYIELARERAKQRKLASQ